MHLCAHRISSATRYWWKFICLSLEAIAAEKALCRAPASPEKEQNVRTLYGENFWKNVVRYSF